MSDITQRWDAYTLQMMERISPLYWEFSRQIEHDPEILALEALVEPHQPRPITFFALVNSLLIRDQYHPLAGYYPYLSSCPNSAKGAYPSFRAFCLSHLEELRTMLPGARLQTNEVSRCGNWLPALELVYRRGGLLPLSLVEIGCSAGLNLLVDQYRYLYRDTDANRILFSGIPSPVHIEGIDNLNFSLDEFSPLYHAFIPSTASFLGEDVGSSPTFVLNLWIITLQFH